MVEKYKRNVKDIMYYSKKIKYESQINENVQGEIMWELHENMKKTYIRIIIRKPIAQVRFQSEDIEFSRWQSNLPKRPICLNTLAQDEDL